MSGEFRIVSPCSRDRDSLEGAGAVRYCPDCRKNVHDFSKLRRSEIDRLVAAGSVCGIVDRDLDGSLRTADPPSWSRLMRRQFLRWTSAFAATWIASAQQSPPLQDGTGGLRGVILDPTGYPIPNTRLLIGIDRTAVADGIGGFEMMNLPAGFYLLVVQATGFLSTMVKVQVMAGRVAEVGRIELMLGLTNQEMGLIASNQVLLTETAGIAGVVADQFGRLVPQARVEMRELGSGQVFQARGDDLGRFLIENLRPGKYQLRVQVPGFRARELPVKVGETRVNVGTVVLEVGSVGEVVEMPLTPFRRLWNRLIR